MRSVVIGIGNLLRADDGVGAHVVKAVGEQLPDVEAVDLSTADIEVIEHIRNRDVVIIVDAVLTGAEPGTIHRMAIGNLRSAEFARTHSLNLSSVIALAYQLYPDEMPEKITVLGVEAGDVESFSSELTPKVQQAIPRILDEIRNELRIDASLKSDA